MNQNTKSSPRRGASAPPWLWFWVVLFILSLKDLVASFQYTIESLKTMAASSQSLGQLDPAAVRFDALLNATALIDLLPPFALVLGLAWVLLPQLRAAWVERRFALVDPPANFPPLLEVKSFLAEHAPALEVKTNLLRAGDLAFVYPASYLCSRVALFGGFFRLWKADRPAAEAVLLHEIGHHRLGDAQIVGAGSFFEAVVRHSPVAVLILLIFPVTATTANGIYNLVAWSRQFAIPFSTVMAHAIGQLFTLVLPGVILGAAVSLLQMMNYLWLPIAGIWTAELNADRFAAERLGSAEPVRAALAPDAGRLTWWRWLLFRLYHPPARLRRWAVADASARSRLLLLLLFPLTSVVKLGVSYLYSIMAMFPKPLSESIPEVWGYLVAALPTHVPKWAAMAGVLLVWPLLRPYWERLFSHDRSATRPAYQSSYGIAPSNGRRR